MINSLSIVPYNDFYCQITVKTIFEIFKVKKRSLRENTPILNKTYTMQDTINPVLGTIYHILYICILLCVA